jgi:hypothetical protein
MIESSQRMIRANRRLKISARRVSLLALIPW